MNVDSIRKDSRFNIAIGLFTIAIVAKLFAIYWHHDEALKEAKKIGAEEERGAILAWLDGTSKGLVSIKAFDEAKTVNAINAMIRANSHYDFRTTIADLDAQNQVNVTP